MFAKMIICCFKFLIVIVAYLQVVIKNYVVINLKF